MLQSFPTGVKVLGYHLGGSSGRGRRVTVVVRHNARWVIRTVGNPGGIFKRANRTTFKLLESAPLISVIYFSVESRWLVCFYFSEYSRWAFSDSPMGVSRVGVRGLYPEYTHTVIVVALNQRLSNVA